ncbi:putative ALIX V-shaped domain binding to HIV [Blattamonas nauphoetae]|uniref:ALIX V-shaped domain binding to HIV n=1 Tax=Blattamonas nauphoetae TaxID=2049346 RepID=A0ABQ9YEF3_9EUKA|nr:putative ALIX V-shaped domain binding to HIV [Blattamonas nauphoetae]
MFAPLPVKQTSALDLSKPLISYLKSNFDTKVFVENQPSCDIINGQRITVAQALARPENAREALVQYLAMLRSMSIKFATFRVPFKWTNAFNPKETFVNDQLNYEIICVMWNIAAALTHEVKATRNDQQGLSKKSRSLRLAASWLQEIRDMLKMCTFAPDTLDLNDQMLSLMILYLRTQSFETFLQFLIIRPSANDEIYPRAMLIANCYDEVEKNISDISKGKFDKAFLARLRCGRYKHLAIAHERIAPSFDESMEFGHELGHLKAAIFYLEEAKKLMAATKPSSVFQFDLELANHDINSVLGSIKPREEDLAYKCDNVYFKAPVKRDDLQPITPYSPLPALFTGDAIDKETDVPQVPSSDPSQEPPEGMRFMDQPVFTTLVPEQLKQFTAQYEQETQNLLRQCYDENDTVRRETRGVIEQNQMTSLITIGKGSTTNLPPHVLEKCLEVRKTGGMKACDAALNKMETIKMQCLQGMAAARQDLTNTRNSAQSMGRSVMGLSDLEPLVTDYQNRLDQAGRIDTDVSTKMNEVRDTITTVCADTLPGFNANDAVPLGSPAGNNAYCLALITALLPPQLRGASASTSEIKPLAEQLEKQLNAFQERENAIDQALEELRTTITSNHISSKLMTKSSKTPAEIMDESKQAVQAKVDQVHGAFNRAKETIPPIMATFNQLSQQVQNNPVINYAGKVAEDVEQACLSLQSTIAHLQKAEGFYTNFLPIINNLKDRAHQLALSSPGVPPSFQSYPQNFVNPSVQQFAPPPQAQPQYGQPQQPPYGQPPPQQGGYGQQYFAPPPPAQSGYQSGYPPQFQPPPPGRPY